MFNFGAFILFKMSNCYNFNACIDGAIYCFFSAVPVDSFLLFSGFGFL